MMQLLDLPPKVMVLPQMTLKVKSLESFQDIKTAITVQLKTPGKGSSRAASGSGKDRGLSVLDMKIIILVQLMAIFNCNKIYFI